MSEPDLRALSVEMERETMCDSILTIERNYLRYPEPDGPFCCAFCAEATYGQEHCKVRRRDPVAMWKHVHFGSHGNSFGMTLEKLIASRSVGSVQGSEDPK